MTTRNTNIMGSSFYAGAGNIIMRLRPDAPLILEREPTNKYDANAIKVCVRTTSGGARQLGHVSRQIAAHLAPLMDAGLEVQAVKMAGSDARITLTWDGPEMPDVQG